MTVGIIMGKNKILDYGPDPLLLRPLAFACFCVRDWLEQQDWNKKAPAPELPEEILWVTVKKYQEALRLLA